MAFSAGATFVDEIGEDDEEKSIVLDDLDDLDDSDIYDPRISSSTPIIPSKYENKLINKSSPFPAPNEFYLYTPLGKLDKCMQCKAAFTSSHMLANHIVKVHPKVSKHPKPIPKHPNATEPLSTILILPSAEFQGPAATPVKRQRGRPPKAQVSFGSYSGVTEGVNPAKRYKPNDTSDNYNTNNNNYNVNNNNFNANNHNNSNNNNYNHTITKTQTNTSTTIEALKKTYPPQPALPHSSAPIHISNPSPSTSSALIPTNTAASKILNLENLAKKIENLAMLRKVADQGLISEQQYQQKQEEFLQSVSFL